MDYAERVQLYIDQHTKEELAEYIVSLEDRIESLEDSLIMAEWRAGI